MRSAGPGRNGGGDGGIQGDAEKIHVETGRVTAVTTNGRTIKPRAVVSNSNLRATIFRMTGEEHFDKKFVQDAREVRLNNSSTQVYIALKPDERVDESMGDLLFTSTAPLFRTALHLLRHSTNPTSSL